MIYLLPEDYEKAKKKGIGEKTLYARVYTLGWSKERALNEPLQSRRDLQAILTDEVRAELSARGISLNTFRGRLKRGWEVERAITAPPTRHVKKSHLKYPREVVEKAESNGISYETFVRRVKEGWDMHEASEVKPLSKTEAARLSKSGGYIVNKEVLISKG